MAVFGDLHALVHRDVHFEVDSPINPRFDPPAPMRAQPSEVESARGLTTADAPTPYLFAANQELKRIEQESAMPSKLRQSLIIVTSVVAVAFVVAGSERHAKHGANAVIGAIAWFTFLPGLLVLAVVAAAAGITTVRHSRLVRRGQH